MSRKCLGLIAVAAWSIGACASAWASEAYPTKPIRVVVGYLPGGPIDVVLRPLAQKLTETFGQPVVVDNRPGANGNIGAEAVAKAAPDGYTLLMATLAQLTNNPSLYPSLPFDTGKDFAPITLMATSPGAVVVHPSVPARSLSDLIALAKSRPGTLNFSSTGNGSANHLAGELFKLLAKIDMVHVPYKGGSPALNAVVSGQVETIIISLPLSTPFLKAGRLRALALCGESRSPLWPDVPTTAEAGLPGLESRSGPGLLAPARTSRGIIAKLHMESVKALTQSELRERFVAQGLDVIANTPEEFASVISRDTARWAKIVKSANIRL